jgi:hypothetical protein
MKLIISGFILFSVLLVSNIHCAGDQSSVIWKSASNGAIPAGAIVAGHESDGPILYAARAYYQGGLHPGKIETGFGGAHIAWGGKEISVPNYEVFCGVREGYYTWVRASGGNIPSNAIEVGHESDGPILYATRAYYQGGLHPGKIETGFGGAHIAWGGKEISVPNYEVLCWISPREGATYGSKSGKGETSGSSQSSSNNDGSESDQSDELVE